MLGILLAVLGLVLIVLAFVGVLVPTLLYAVVGAVALVAGIAVAGGFSRGGPRG